MSLFSHEEICDGCIRARWIDGKEFWNGERRFKECSGGYEQTVNHATGRCPHKAPAPEVDRG